MPDPWLGPFGLVHLLVWAWWSLFVEFRDAIFKDADADLQLLLPLLEQGHEPLTVAPRTYCEFVVRLRMFTFPHVRVHHCTFPTL